MPFIFTHTYVHMYTYIQLYTYVHVCMYNFILIIFSLHSSSSTWAVLSETSCLKASDFHLTSQSWHFYLPEMNDQSRFPWALCSLTYPRKQSTPHTVSPFQHTEGNHSGCLLSGQQLPPVLLLLLFWFCFFLF